MIIDFFFQKKLKQNDATLLGCSTIVCIIGIPQGYDWICALNTLNHS